MSQVTCLPRSLKMKLVWLVAAFVVVWMNAPAGSLGGDGVSKRTLTVAMASASRGGDAAPADGAAAASAPAPEPALSVRLAAGEVAKSEGLRLGVLAVVDEPVPLAVAREAGERQVWVYVALDNAGTRDVAYSAVDFELTDGRGLFSSVEGRRGPGPMLTFGVLRPGEVTSGWRIFRVPTDSGPFQLLCDTRAGF
jgi:hypothetical protein